jgi:mRNA-degrading endonuclease RelE of RelBE toxin-antitoxin system
LSKETLYKAGELPGFSLSMFEIKFTDDAKADLRYFKKARQSSILDDIERQLRHQPEVETKNRKKPRENVIASYELRIDDVRIFYNVYAAENVVDIVAIGWKEHNDIFIKGKKVDL